MSAHTLGPWKVVSTEKIAMSADAFPTEELLVRTADGHELVAIIPAAHWHEGKRRFDIEQADACLVAAAPDLLKWLQWYMDASPGHPDARAAVRKALGQEATA